MKRRILLLVLSMIVLFSSFIAASAQTNIVDSMDFLGSTHELSFNGAISILLKDSTSVKIEQINIQQAKINADKLVDTINSLQKAVNYSNDLAAGKGLKISKLNRDYFPAQAQRNYDCTVAGLKADLEKSYYGLLQAQQNVDIYKNNLDVTKDLLDKAQKRFELGMAAKQEVLSGEYAYTKAVTDYNASVNSFKNAKMNLNIVLNFNVMDEIKLKDGLKPVEFIPGSIAGGVSKALESRNEIKAVEYAYNMQQITAEAERMTNSDSIAYSLEKLNLDKAAQNVDITKKRIEQEVRGNYMSLLQKADEIKAGQKLVDNTAEALKISKTKYESGLGVLTDVQSAQIEYMRAQLGLSAAILDYNLAVSTYKDSISVGRAKQ